MTLTMSDLSQLPEDPTTPRAPRSTSHEADSEDAAGSSQAASSPLSARSGLDDADGDESLGPATSELFPTPLPEDTQSLHALLDVIRNHYDTMRGELSHVRRSHTALLKRSSSWQDDLEAHRRRVPQLEAALKKEVSEREEEQNKVKDLRMRAEESRRAIMRLQGEQSDARTKAKSENRRSMGPGAMANWNVSAGASSGASSPPLREGLDEAEVKELKKSKRASLAFGPNAGSAIAAAGRGHRRTASGSRLESGDEAEQQQAPNFASGAQTIGRSGGGLRGLRLSGVPGSISSSHLSALRDVDTNGTPPSQRSSMVSNPSRMSTSASPRSNLTELYEEDPIAQAEAALTRRVPPSRSSESHLSLSLPVPQRSNSSSASASGVSSVGSPILEDADEGGTSVGTSAAGTSVGSGSNYAAMRATAELRAKDAEVQRLRLRLEDMRVQLDEAVEARTASEVCLQALRDFIATHDEAADREKAAAGNGAEGEAVGSGAVQGASESKSVGATLLRGFKLPPLPTDADEDTGNGSGAKDGGSKSAAPSSASTWTMRLPQMMRGNTSETAGTSGTATAEKAGNNLSTSPAAPIGATFSSLWSRAGAPKEDERRKSSANTDAASSVAEQSPTAGAGAGIRSWFNRRASEVPSGPWSQAGTDAKHLSGSSSNSASSPTASRTLSPPGRSPTHSMPSPPFASLDHSALTNEGGSPVSPSLTHTPPTTDAPPQVGTQRRAMQNRGRIGGLGEDDLFAPPAFD